MRTEPIPRDTDYSSVIRSDVLRQAENALLSTIAYPNAA